MGVCFILFFWSNVFWGLKNKEGMGKKEKGERKTPKRELNTQPTENNTLKLPVELHALYVYLCTDYIYATNF